MIDWIIRGSCVCEVFSFPSVCSDEGKQEEIAMSLSSRLARMFLLGGMAIGACTSSIGFAASGNTTAQQGGLKQITAPFSGSVSPAGAVEDNSTGKIIGEVDRTGVVYDNTGTVVGSIDSKGTVRNARGVAVAQVAQNNRLAGIAFLLGR